MSFYFTSLSGKVCEGARLCCWKTCHKFSRAETLRFQAEVSYREPVAVSLLSPVPLQLQWNPPPTTLQEPQEGVLFCFILEGTYFCVTLQWIMPAGRAGTGTGLTGSKPMTANALWENSHECNGHGQLRGVMSAEKEGQTQQPGPPKSPHHCLSLDPGTQVGTVLDHSGVWELLLLFRCSKRGPAWRCVNLAPRSSQPALTRIGPHNTFPRGVCVHAKWLQSRPILWDPMDDSRPGFSENQRIEAFELWCWGLLRVPWTARRSN